MDVYMPRTARALARLDTRTNPISDLAPLKRERLIRERLVKDRNLHYASTPCNLMIGSCNLIMQGLARALAIAALT